MEAKKPKILLCEDDPNLGSYHANLGFLFSFN